MPLSAQHEREGTLDGAAIDLCIAQAVAARAAADECQRRADGARICANASDSLVGCGCGRTKDVLVSGELYLSEGGCGAERAPHMP
jgi:hypothetical protein